MIDHEPAQHGRDRHGAWSRRALLAWGGAALTIAGGGAAAAGATPPRPLRLPDGEWRRRLPPAAYAVLRQDGTERAYTSPLLNEHRPGLFTCAGCTLPLFAAHTKFDSGTGWPSFWAHLPDAVRQRGDTSFGVTRTEVRCARCDGHLGHVFDDGPRPTGLRYCMNGVALGFTPGRGRPLG